MDYRGTCASSRRGGGQPFRQISSRVSIEGPDRHAARDWEYTLRAAERRAETNLLCTHVTATRRCVQERKLAKELQPVKPYLSVSLLPGAPLMASPITLKVPST